jgi:hypothetical protein
MAYAAYLRVYEPVSAIREPERTRWTAYADSPARPRRRDSLAAEHAEALRRAITTPQVVVPEQESEHAYVRRAAGVTYVCPWQTRLRCLLADGQPRSAVGDQAMAAPGRLHILASVWTVPLTWFVPFAPAERWLSLGEGQGRASVAATASATRAVVYTTPLPRARRRVARGLAALRHLPAGSGDAVLEPSRAVGDLAEVGRWLEDFHPNSLVELDYGGLVHLVSDDALCGDQSVAEIRAAVDGAARDECELAVAMYLRARNRWRAFADFEQAN